jgi:hypothetical protein
MITYTIAYTIYYILYTIYYILYTIYYILYTIYYILYTIYYILYTIQKRLTNLTKAKIMRRLLIPQQNITSKYTIETCLLQITKFDFKTTLP